jgi:hypothetical protein
LEKLEEKQRIELAQKQQKAEEAELAKKKFLSAFGKPQAKSSSSSSTTKQGPINVKRVLVTQTKVDEDGFECTEDVWVEMPVDNDVEVL